MLIFCPESAERKYGHLVEPHPDFDETYELTYPPPDSVPISAAITFPEHLPLCLTTVQ